MDKMDENGPLFGRLLAHLGVGAAAHGRIGE